MLLDQYSLDDACLFSTTYDVTQDFQTSAFVDIFDKNIWRVAQIVSRSGNLIDIHFEAWSQKYDVKNIPVNSICQVGAFRSHSVGYTGQPKIPFREFKFSESECELFANKLKDFIKLNFKVKDTSMEITQFLRGKLFFYIDSILTLDHLILPSPENLKQILQFLDIVFELIIAYVLAFPSLKNEYEKTKHFPNLYLVQRNAALSLCYQEFAEILKLCLGYYKKRTEESFHVLNF